MRVREDVYVLIFMIFFVFDRALIPTTRQDFDCRKTNPGHRATKERIMSQNTHFE